MGTKGHLLQRTSPKFRYSTLSCLRSNDPRLVKCLVHNERSVVFKKDKVKQQAIPLNSKPRFQTSRIVYKSSLSSSMCREHQVYRTDGCGPVLRSTRLAPQLRMRHYPLLESTRSKWHHS